MTGGGGGIGGSSDGRLDLDELGEIVDAPGGYRLGDASSDTDVLGDDSRVSLGERLEAAGVLPWVRRHRVVLGATAAVVVGVGVAGTAYASSRPPDVATVPGVEVFSVDITNGFLEVSGLRTAQQSYQVVPDASTATARVDGLRGPGIRTATSVDVPGAAAVPQQTLLAVLECDDRALEAQPSDYQIHVSSTDVWGRTVDAWMEAPVSNLDWVSNVSSMCWDQVARERIRLESVAATLDESDGAIALTLEVHNGLPVSAFMIVGAGDWDGVGFEDSLAVTADARSTVRLDGRMLVRSCTDPPSVPEIAMPTNVSNTWVQRPGIPVVVTGQGQGYGNSVGLTIDAATTERLQSMLDRICDGAPRVELVGSGYSAALSLGGSGVQVPLNLRLRLPDGVTGTAVSSGLDAPSGTVGTPVAIRAGRVSVPWAFVCDYVPQPVSVTVRAKDRSGRTWPLRVDVPLEVQAGAVIAACPTFTPQRLVDEGGWGLDVGSVVEPTTPVPAA